MEALPLEKEAKAKTVPNQSLANKSLSQVRGSRFLSYAYFVFPIIRYLGDRVIHARDTLLVEA
jgi:hypothetical protein